MGSQHIWPDEGFGEVDPAVGRDRTGQELDQPYRASVRLQQVPAAVYYDGRKGLLLCQHIVESVADFSEIRSIEVAFAPHRSEAGRNQQLILLTQRQIKRCCQANYHVAARRGSPNL